LRQADPPPRVYKQNYGSGPHLFAASKGRLILGATTFSLGILEPRIASCGCCWFVQIKYWRKPNWNFEVTVLGLWSWDGSLFSDTVLYFIASGSPFSINMSGRKLTAWRNDWHQ